MTVVVGLGGPPARPDADASFAQESRSAWSREYAASAPAPFAINRLSDQSITLRGMSHHIPATPGRALVMANLVTTLPGLGLREGTQLIGRPLTIGPTNTTFQGIDTEHTRPNHELQLWPTRFINEARRHGVDTTEPGPHIGRTFTPAWEWLGWTVQQHAEQDLTAASDLAPLVIISCGAAKTDVPTEAAQLYTGTYFQLALRAARAHAPDDRIRVLSALHGIVPLHQVLDPYNLRLGDHGSITPARLANQTRKLWLQGCRDVTVLAGRDYVALARTVWPHAAAPLLGTRGIGDQQRVLVQMAAQSPAA